MIYLDHNATTPIASDVFYAMLPFLREHYGNPSSSHSVGRRAHDAIEVARAQVAKLIGAAPDEIIFTSGGTEASNLAIRGAVLSQSGRPHIITSAFEHPATAQSCAWAERQGYRVTRVPVAADGRIRPEDVARAVDDHLVLITMMHSNNEIGTVQPIAQIARIGRARGALIHTDAAQSVGKVPVNVDELGVDLLTIAGHKLYAPKGVGALYIRRGTALERVLEGAGHERGMRPGTENVAGIVALGEACRIAERDLISEQTRVRGLRDRLLQRLRDSIPGLVLHGHPTERLPNTLFISFPNVPGARLLEAVPEIAASTGSACHSGSDAPCDSLLAIGTPPDQAVGPVRLSLGRSNTAEEIDAAAEQLFSAWRRLTGELAHMAS